MLRSQTACGAPDAAATSGLVAYVDGQPAGWVAVEQRLAEAANLRGKEITWGEIHVGACQVFEEAGFVEASRPTARRVVMRIDFEHGRFRRTSLGLFRCG